MTERPERRRRSKLRFETLNAFVDAGITQAELTKLLPSERLWVVLYGPAHHGQSMIEESIPAGWRLQEQRDFEAIKVLLYAR